jgi:hypothetical protein
MNYTNLDRVVVISIGFFLLFSAFSSSANLSASAMQEDGFDKLGFYSMAILYFVFSFTSFFSYSIVNKLGTKKSLVIGALCYSLWVFSFLLPAFKSENLDDDRFLFNKTFIYCIILTASAINGFGAGILWVSEGQYVSECASDDNKGFFNSLFWAIFMCSQIIGNLVGGLVLGKA